MASTLAWASEHGIPFSDALRTLPTYQKAKPLADVVEALAGGVHLGTALRMHMSNRLPESYLAGVEWAESEGRLETALPALAEQMRHPALVRRQRLGALLTQFVEAVSSLATLGFLSVFVLPRLVEIMSDFSRESEGGAALPLWITHASAWYTQGVALLLAIIVVSTVIVIGFPDLADRLPIIGRVRRRFMVLDFARAMHARLEQEDDIVAAALFARHASTGSWIRRRADRFVTEVESGTSWTTAWEKSGMGSPIEDWVVRNAAQREDPSDAFHTIAQWIYQDLDQASTRLERWIAPCTTLILGCCIGAIVIAIHSALISIFQTLL